MTCVALVCVQWATLYEKRTLIHLQKVFLKVEKPFFVLIRSILKQKGDICKYMCLLGILLHEDSVNSPFFQGTDPCAF